MAQMLILKIYKDNQLVEERKIKQDCVVIGSSHTQAHLRLSGNIAPMHASLERRGDHYVVCDLGSKAGTYKGDDKVLEAKLKPGDKISLGEFTIEFDLEKSSPESSLENLVPPPISSTPEPSPGPKPVASKEPEFRPVKGAQKTPVEETPRAPSDMKVAQKTSVEEVPQDPFRKAFK